MEVDADIPNNSPNPAGQPVAQGSGKPAGARCVLWHSIAADGEGGLPAGLLNSLCKRGVQITVCTGPYRAMANLCRLAGRGAQSGEGGGEVVLLLVEPRKLEQAAEVVLAAAKYAPGAACWLYETKPRPQMRSVTPEDVRAWQTPPAPVCKPVVVAPKPVAAPVKPAVQPVAPAATPVPASPAPLLMPAPVVKPLAPLPASDPRRRASGVSPVPGVGIPGATKNGTGRLRLVGSGDLPPARDKGDGLGDESGGAGGRHTGEDAGSGGSKTGARGMLTDEELAMLLADEPPSGESVQEHGGPGRVSRP